MVDVNSQVEFVFNAEAGILERQAVLLCQSIRLFGGALSSSPITIVSPRKSRRPARSTLDEISRLGAEFLPLDLDSYCPEYGPSFKVHALAHIASRSGPPIIVQIDSDSLFVAEPMCLPRIGDAAARPVDVKGMCTTGSLDEFDGYWRVACDLLDVSYDAIPVIQTTVDRLLVRASYNGGLFAARRSSGIFERTEEFFQRLLSADLKPWNIPGFAIKSGTELVSEVGSAFWGTSQMSLSLAAIDRGCIVDILPETYNVPLHFLEDLDVRASLPLVHIHYHWLASSGAQEATPLLDERLNLTTDVREWLKSQLPLRVEE